MDLERDIIAIDRKSPAATNRYIYYPDRLVRMPTPDPNRGLIGNIWNAGNALLNEPIFRGVIQSVVTEYTRECRSRGVMDESVGHFLKRRFGASIADNIASAFFHGIYAGDIYKLSMATLLPGLWYMETRDVENKGGVVLEAAELFFRGHQLRGLEDMRYLNLARQTLNEEDEVKFQMMLHQTKPWVAYTFVKGTGQLTDALVNALKANSNVTIQTDSKVQSLTFDKANNKVSVLQEGRDETEDFDYIASSVSPKQLGRLIQARPNKSTQIAVPTMPTLYDSPNQLKAVNTMVVNLYYKSPSLPIPSGFGYLIPRTLPMDQNPERALGVLFASEASGPKGDKVMSEPTLSSEYLSKLMREMRDASGKAQSTYEPDKSKVAAESLNEQLKILPEQPTFETIQIGQDTASGTKLAVILGGHWWEGWSESDMPSEEDGIRMAKSVIARHLNVTEEPLVAKARLQKDCIPQYQVGYRDHMGKIHRELLQAFDGRLKVMGTWWQGGVGVNDCIKAAQETSMRIRLGANDETGLERFTQPPKFVLIDKRSKRMVMDPMQKT